MTATLPYRDSSLPIDVRLDDLLARMTMAEKVGQMLQLDARGDLEDLVSRKLVGSIYADLTQEPLFVFGEGLSFTRVEYSDLSLLEDVVGPDGVVRAEVTLTNTGDRPALETVQVYVSDLVTSVTWAEKELKAYRQVLLPAGSTMTVTLEVPVASLSLVTADGRRLVEPGEFELLVGRSSRGADLLRARVTVGLDGGEPLLRP